ncbi:hypothetical protein WP8S17C03_22940 [Metapseudomonas otitidis]|uniref:Uncharacterized protein n=1 Tax=Metapseudomonas otitidis TaxID=319939 RepID=A0A6S5RTP7_9GAMM|nr:LPO_1073/Vpar_1526 family protein [Pseudomonas otitidis]BBT16245.1 hypothetical protein WP8S17C03_22940 [Pseudomonas otitidis]
MLGPKQDQQVQGDGTAIQATGDVHVEKHYHGLQVTEVRELTQLFLERQLPALRDEALRVMHENTQEFVELVVARLARTDKVTHEAFSKPDAQVCFNEALKGSAEKGEDIDLDMLADMVIGRLEAAGDPLLKLVYENSVRVFPRLTDNHIAFLAFNIWMHNVEQRNLRSMADLERFCTVIQPVVAKGLDLSEVSREYLGSLGLITQNLVASDDSGMALIRRKHSFVPENMDEISAQAPTLFSLMAIWRDKNYSTSFPNATGKLIGLLALQKVLGKFDMGIFIH